MKYLYHYTSSQGLRGILNDGVIWSSDDTRDAVYGKGVYLTSLPPTTDIWDLLENNWDGSPQFYLTKLDNLDYCIEFRKKDLPHVQKTGDSRDVWKVPHDIDLGVVQFRVWKR
jgi:hypothetical protein